MHARLLTVLTVAVLATFLPASATAAETSWTPVTPALVPENPGSVGLFDVAAVSPADVWALGAGRSEKLMAHWSGTGWQRFALPSVPNFDYDLWAVDAVSERDAWAVGDGNAPEAWPISTSAIAHYDGTTWSMAPAPATPSSSSDALFDVDMLSATDGWAVGWRITWFDTGETAQQPFVVRWRNGRWRTVRLPEVDNGLLQQVYARAANDVWAVGSSWGTGLVMHFDGVRWSRIDVPDSGVADSDSTLWSVTAVSAGEAWAVGETCVGVVEGVACQPFILHLSGGVWRVVPTAGDRGTNLRDVVARSSDDVWVVGYDAGPPDGVGESNYVEHWDGQRFTTVPTDGGSVSVRGQLASALQAATQLPGTGELWAVGWQAGSPQVIRHG